MAADFDFDDLKPAEVTVRYKGQDYVLREASEAAHVAYQNAIAKAVKLGPDRNPVSFEGIASTRVVLVAACLFNRGVDGGLAAMTPAEVGTWPAKLVRRLYEWVEEASEINAKDTPESVRAEIARLERKLASMPEDPAKNGHSSTTATSPQPTS